MRRTQTPKGCTRADCDCQNFTLASVAKAEAKLARYEAALRKAVDTFREFERAFTILRRPAVAEAAKIAADWTTKALEEK